MKKEEEKTNILGDICRCTDFVVKAFVPFLILGLFFETKPPETTLGEILKIVIYFIFILGMIGHALRSKDI